MENLSAKIVFRQSWNNLVDLPSNAVSLLYNANVSPQQVIIELVLPARDKTYVGWSGMNSRAPMAIEIDPTLAQSLHLTENQPVTMNVLIGNLRSSNILLEPEQFSDWELVEVHAAHIESKLIEQSRCVAKNQVLIVYPTRTSSVRLKVMDIGLHQQFALIDPFCEVSIAPKKKEKKACIVSHSLKPIMASLEQDLYNPTLLKRGVSTPNSLFPDFSLDSNSHGYEIYGNIQEFTHTIGHCDFLSISIVNGPTSKIRDEPRLQAGSQRGIINDSTKLKPEAPMLENKHIVAKFVDHLACPKNMVGLSKNLAIALSVEKSLGYKVVITKAPNSFLKTPSAIVVHPYYTKSKRVDHLRSTLTKQIQTDDAKKLSQILFPSDLALRSPISNYCRLPIIPKYLPHGGLMVFKRSVDPHAWIRPPSMGNPNKTPQVHMGEFIQRPLFELQDIEEELERNPIYGFDPLLDEVTGYLNTFKNTGVMIHGTQGCGKTAMLKLLANSCSNNCVLFTKIVTCETLMHENTDQLRLKMTKCIYEAVWNQPSVLIFDNLDKLLSAEIENTDSSASDQLSAFFVSLMRNVRSQKNTDVSLLVAGSSKESFNKQFVQSHLIEKYCHIGVPDKATRRTILHAYLSTHLRCSLSFDLMEAVLKTEGYLPNDLKVLSDRMYYESLHRKNKKPLSLIGNKLETNATQHDFNMAIRSFKPSSLRRVKLERSGTHWEDIGGMTQAKRILLETLEWPTKYAPIFANCPLRLRSGLLLYGYPGCGKTLLASAIPGQCGLNFISIKGPEILNKYIGASEQSVRELFERAQSAKPCILFFDEFDLIAPKRGHDSTGVTDRVVNQMLTQMDGAEGLDGVYVLAATSRPDLIDSALLRPGRLDKSIFCDMPAYHDRLSILSCICENMKLLADVQLDVIASETSGFSGADLQGLGYNAYLKAVHEKLAAEDRLTNSDDSVSKTSRDFFRLDSGRFRGKIRTPGNAAIQQQIESLVEQNDTQKDSLNAVIGTKKAQVWIGQDHFLCSLRESKLSISVSEKAKLSKIYRAFLTHRDGNMPDGSPSHEIGGRATLM